jgi:hypothetical protein
MFQSRSLTIKELPMSKKATIDEKSAMRTVRQHKFTSDE